MDDILADLAGSRKLPGYRCFMHDLRAANAPLAEQAQRGIDSTRLTADAVAEWLTAHGAPVTGQVIRNHRLGKCATCKTSSQS